MTRDNIQCYTRDANPYRWSHCCNDNASRYKSHARDIVVWAFQEIRSQLGSSSVSSACLPYVQLKHICRRLHILSEILLKLCMLNRSLDWFG